MRLSRNDVGALMWLATAACGLFGFFGFALVAPWVTSVMPVAEAVVRCPGAIDPTWPAVVCSHSHPYVWEAGLIEDHPVRFAVAVAQMIVGVTGFFYGVRRTKAYMNG